MGWMEFPIMKITEHDRTEGRLKSPPDTPSVLDSKGKLEFPTP